MRVFLSCLPRKHSLKSIKIDKGSHKKMCQFIEKAHNRDVRDQFLHVETETETQCTQSQFLIVRLRLLKLVTNFETETKTL